MSVEVTVTGIDQNLKRLAGQHKKAEKAAVKAAADFLADKLKAETPVFDGKEGADYLPKHAKDHVVVGSFKNSRIAVGFDKEVAWRIHFVEIGTIKQKPNAFIERTQREAEQKVMDIIAAELRRGLGL